MQHVMAAAITVSTCIHLNPARAKLIRIGEEKLWHREGRVLELGIKNHRKELEADCKQLGRGWYVGGRKI